MYIILTVILKQAQTFNRSAKRMSYAKDSRHLNPDAKGLNMFTAADCSKIRSARKKFFFQTLKLKKNSI